MEDVSRRKFMKLSGVTLATLAFPGLLAGCGTSTTQSGESKKEFVIGAIGAMTGPSAQLGNNLKYGATVAVDEINAKGGINGIPVRLVILDDEADPTKSLNLARELVTKDKIDAFIGPTNTTCAMAIQPYLNQNKIIHLNGGCTGAALIDAQKYPYSFRTHINDRDQATYMVQRAVKKGRQKIAMVHDTTALGSGALTDMQNAFKQAGKQPAVDCPYTVGDVDMLPVAQKIKDAQCDSALLFALGVDGAHIALALQKLDYLPPKIELHGYTAEGMPAYRDLAKSAAAGSLCNTPTKCTYKENQPIPERLNKIITAYESKFGADATNQIIFATSVSFYDCVYIIKQGVEASKSYNSEKIKGAIESISNYDGANSDYHFSSTKHDGNDPSQLSVGLVTSAKKGLFQIVE
ncbi:amino acid/amide ABC transporter substrate-binding protein, HAAT family [Desulfosporosinus acidiphilus SJ4]|uniref:Amino acid/amide ABC transporter substrate-binding protein, HAAT family n=1 Tax=Desulfosporosinus acidiphilus (strain DSM 22704 / JCM 16185 / SJ4) TaxID=646529 RepID=I4D773_DESAJ|nr:ABC transporter substrate-binding protein [Desulfosporosinus acidiphilus]AFM41647.1 amino acid/amide ABC transporter substrate-binding protein, HAAT family [Desulfosporosinus acidiphilus SJ4]